jgi:hypothetical protein
MGCWPGKFSGGSIFRNSGRSDGDKFINKWRGNMSSELPRWKEYRIKQEIYREYLKHAETQSGRPDSEEATPQSLNENPTLFLEQDPAGKVGLYATASGNSM